MGIIKCYCKSLFHCFDPSPADVNSWLVTFGFQLYNVIPGYRKPSTEAMEPSYELVSTQIKTQEWDSTKVNLSLSPIHLPCPIHLNTDHLFNSAQPPFPASLANRHALRSHSPRGAASYQAKTQPSELGPCPESSSWGMGSG